MWMWMVMYISCFDYIHYSFPKFGIANCRAHAQSQEESVNECENISTSGNKIQHRRAKKLEIMPNK